MRLAVLLIALAFAVGCDDSDDIFTPPSGDVPDWDASCIVVREPTMNCITSVSGDGCTDEDLIDCDGTTWRTGGE